MSGVCSVVGTFEMTSKPTKTARMKIQTSVNKCPLTRLLRA
jgi:hypothetical protein